MICKRLGHRWERIAISKQGGTIDQCAECQALRTISANNQRKYTFQSPDDVHLPTSFDEYREQLQQFHEYRNKLIEKRSNS